MAKLHLESVSGLSQHAVLVDVAAKVLADNIASLLSAEADSSRAEEDVSKPDRPRKSNRALAAHTIARALPAILLRVGSVIDLINDVIDKLASDSRRTKPGRSNPRPIRPYKPHPALFSEGVRAKVRDIGPRMGLRSRSDLGHDRGAEMHSKTDPKPTEPPAQPPCNDNFVMPNLDESRVYAR